MIKTVLPIELPGQQFCASPLNCTDTSHLTKGSIFLVDGSLDIPISPPTQPASATGLQSIAAYYSAVRVGVIKVKGTPIGPTHCDVQGVPNCTPTTVPCFLGVYGYLGYPTAWMMFQLQNDNLAHGAFIHCRSWNPGSGFRIWSLELSFQKIWRKMPTVSSTSVEERFRRRTRRRIFSSVGEAERRFWELLGFG